MQDCHSILLYWISTVQALHDPTPFTSDSESESEDSTDRGCLGGLLLLGGGVGGFLLPEGGVRGLLLIGGVVGDLLLVRVGAGGCFLTCYKWTK